MSPDLDLLWPRPQIADTSGEAAPLPREPRVVVSPAAPELEGIRERLCRALVHHGYQPRLEGPTEGEPGILLERAEVAARRPQSYRLQVAPHGVRVVAGDAPGLHYGVCTLIQWLELHRGRLAPGLLQGGEPTPVTGLEVEDWPDLPVRGYLLDVSRDKVPTMKTLVGLVEHVAYLKLNQLQLYTEHTFAYRGHEEVWREASPLTVEEVRALDAFCRERFIELVPNQNSFGHFHRWLIHDRYRPLAEVPEGFEHPFSDRPEPFSLCPTDPGSLDLLADLYDQLLPCFTSRQLNVGLDETMDLGQGRSAALVEKQGKVRVYLDFLHGIHRLAAERGRRIQFWGDIILERPELISELPPDAVALAWGYEADHPLLEQARSFADSGLEFLLCPGTSSWNSLAGRSTNALLNLGRAAVAAREAAGNGVLICDWGDNGHLQPLPVSELAILAGAGFAWSTSTAEDPLSLPVEALLDHHAFGDRAGVTGAVARQLGDAYLHTGTASYNGSPLFHLLAFAHQDLEHTRYRGLTTATLAAARDHVEEWCGRLAEARMERPDGALIRRELEWVAALMRLACDLGSARLAAGAATPAQGLPEVTRRTLLAALEPLIEEHGPVWLARNRPGGRIASRARLDRLAALLME